MMFLQNRHVTGNTVPSSPMCVHFDALKQLVVESKGFDFLEEGKRKKKGFVGLKPGVFQVFCIERNHKIW